MQLEKKIHLWVRKQIEKSQKEYYLRSRLRPSRRNWARTKTATLRSGNTSRRSDAQMPKEVEEKALYELERLYKMPPMVARPQ